MMRIAYVDGCFYSLVNGRLFKDTPPRITSTKKAPARRKGKSLRDRMRKHLKNAMMELTNG